MKNYYFLIVGFLFFGIGNAQIINFPDANLKTKLLTSSTGNTVPVASILFQDPAGYPLYYNKIDTNNDGEIQISEALLIKSLDISNANITNLTGLSYFSNLHTLFCHYNQVSSLSEVNLITSLVQFQMNYNSGLTQINLSNLINLKTLTFISCNINALNVANNINLQNLTCQINNLTTLDVSNCSKLNWLKCFYNKIKFLNIKNGNLNSWNSLFIENGENFLRYVCADEEDVALVQSSISNIPNCHVNTYCSFTTGGTYYTIQGNNKLDYNNNGCDAMDVNYPKMQYNFTDGNTTGSLISNNSGNYLIPVGAGTFTITPSIENPTYYYFSPTSTTVTFPASSSPAIQDFCITANGVHNDLEITTVPLESARPGFDAKYKIIYKNKGNQTQSGTINFVFNDAVLDLVSSNPIASSQTVNNLNWSFSNLLPFETREILVTLNLNSPLEIPPVNLGFLLNYTTTITGATDETPLDNIATLNQIVVNSFDPNDKTCLEGATITPSQVGKEVHYMIRFENNGTANAQNIVVKDMIDTAKFDVNSLIPIKGSHSFVTRITNTNKVEFIFENINLPFEDANNDGYVAFKIKTKPTLVLGNTFSNTASIYFDYNFPIITNQATTTVSNVLANQDFEFSNYFAISPNPAKEILTIDSNQDIAISSISIYNVLGQVMQVIPNAKDIKNIDVSSLKSGNYFVKVISDKGTSSSKFLKE